MVDNIVKPTDSSSSRARILDAASAEFAQFGYAGARVARIARRAALNKQLLYYYFGSKAGLHEAVVSTAPPAPWAPTGSTEPLPEQLRCAVQNLFGTLQAHPETVALLADRQRGARAAAAAHDFTATAVRSLANVISQGQGMGYFNDEVNPASVALQALVLCAGFLAFEPVLPDGAAARARWAGEVSALLLRAMTW